MNLLKQLPFDNLLTFLKKDKRAPLLPAIILLGLIIITLVQTSNYFSTTPALILKTPKHAIQHSVNVLPKLANWHLFGTYKPNLNILPRTDLNLQLEGTEVATTSSYPSHAIIGNNGQAHSYKIGDTISGGATIYQILHDRVILRHNGALEVLYLKRPKLSENAIQFVDTP